MIAPVVDVVSTTPTAISLSWRSAGSVVNSYELQWENDISKGCPIEDKDNVTTNGDTTNYNITGLEEDHSYIINITATNAIGSASSVYTVVTKEAGEIINIDKRLLEI